MPREPIPTWFFALVDVRDDQGRFLLVHELKHGQTWSLPGGRVELGETLVAGALRETLEESGVRPVLEGILRIEQTPSAHHTRFRVFFQAHPDETHGGLEAVPDDESFETAWVGIDDVVQYPLRGDEVRRVLHYVAGGGPIMPLAFLTLEGDPWHLPASSEDCGQEFKPL